MDEFKQFKEDYDPEEFIKHSNKGGKDSMVKVDSKKDEKCARVMNINLSM